MHICVCINLYLKSYTFKAFVNTYEYFVFKDSTLVAPELLRYNCS